MGFEGGQNGVVRRLGVDRREPMIVGCFGRSIIAAILFVHPEVGPNQGFEVPLRRILPDISQERLIHRPRLRELGSISQSLALNEAFAEIRSLSGRATCQDGR
jgi:hypothetical protein